MSDVPSWCTGLVGKYGIDAIHIMAEILDAAFYRGECSATDVRHNPGNRHLIGAVFKLARGCGLYATQECKISDSPGRKAGSVRIWRVRDYAILERRRREVRGVAAAVLLNAKPVEGDQFLLDMTG